MSERETNHNALPPYAGSYSIEIRLAGRQLTIASQLNQDIQRRLLVALLKRISSDDVAFFLSSKQTLDGDLIERFADRWDWGNLSGNNVLLLSLNQGLSRPLLSVSDIIEIMEYHFIPKMGL